MTRDHSELQSLLAAYALHAVDEDEAREIEHHVAGCPRCRAELGGYLRAAPLLGSTSDDAPEGLWEDIVATIGDRRETSVPRQVSRALGRRRRWSPWPMLATGFAAAALVLGAVVGMQATGVIGGPSGSTAQRLADAAAAAMAAPHRTVTLTAPDGTTSAKVLIPSGNRAFFVPVDLPRLASGRTYQLWAAVRGAAVSLGTAGSPAEIVEFRVATAMTQFMITAEPEGGVAQPGSSPVLASGRVAI